MAQYHADTHLDKVKKTRDREHLILGHSRPIARIVLSPAWPLANDVDDRNKYQGVGRNKPWKLVTVSSTAMDMEE